MLTRTGRIALVTGTACVVLAGIACSSTTAPTPTGNDNSDITYEPHGSTIFSPSGLPGHPTDEDVDAVLDAAIKPGEGASVVAPTGGATLAAATPFTFTWTYPRDVKSQDDGGTGSLAPSLRPRVAPATLAELLGGERSAFAHGAPFTGTMHLLVFSTTKNPKVLRVVTASTSFTPEDFRWKKLTSAGEPISVQITSAHFTEEVLDDGPYKGPSITFTVK